MASAFASLLAGKKIDAASAGSRPAEKMNPMMISAMEELGIDMMHRPPRKLDDVLAEFKPDMIITMGCGEECPYIPGVERIDWDLPDPAGQTIEVMREIRDSIKDRVESLAGGL